jgi:site-specific DNA-methyltransferase (adenine-specific)
MIEVINSECSEYLDELPENHFHSCVTDPPYELGFMDKEWDNSGIAFDPDFWRRVKRVLKPGAHLAAFGGSETFHRIAVAIEDAGFEIRETVDWIYANGFAKSHDVSKAIDRHLGKENEREAVGYKNNAAKKDGSLVDRDSYENWKDNPSGWQERGRDPYKREAATKEAAEWEGWDTQLKPAKEPIIIARKPFEGTVAENVLERSVGALNVDGCRIPANDEQYDFSPRLNEDPDTGYSLKGSVDGSLNRFNYGSHPDGRWPANVIFDEEMAERLDDQSGRDLGGGSVKSQKTGSEREESTVYGRFEHTGFHPGFGDSGGASRYFKTIKYHEVDNPGFFYCPKAQSKERQIGCDGKGGRPEENDHVTVKPVELMSYLVRLLTPEGGRTLDPFAGSGTTGMAAVLEGVEGTLIEMDSHYADIARARVQATKENYSAIREEIYGNPSNNLTDEQTEVNDHNFW